MSPLHGFSAELAACDFDSVSCYLEVLCDPDWINGSQCALGRMDEVLLDTTHKRCLSSAYR